MNASNPFGIGQPQAFQTFQKALPMQNIADKGAENVTIRSFTNIGRNLHPMILLHNVCYKKFCHEDQEKQTWTYKLIYTCICICGQIMRIWRAGKRAAPVHTHTHIYIYIQIHIYIYIWWPPRPNPTLKKGWVACFIFQALILSKNMVNTTVFGICDIRCPFVRPFPRSSVPSFVHRKTKHVTNNIQKRKTRIRFSIFTSGKQCWTPCARNPEVHHQNNRETKKLACVPLHWLRAPPVS